MSAEDQNSTVPATTDVSEPPIIVEPVVDRHTLGLIFGSLLVIGLALLLAARFLGVPTKIDQLNNASLSTLNSIDMTVPIPGQNWDHAEKTRSGTVFHWMNATAATINLAPTPLDDLALIFRIDQWMSQDILDSINVRANGQFVKLVRIGDSDPAIFEAVIPRGAVAIKPDGVQLILIVSRTISPHEVNAASQDMRPLAIALSGVWYYPLHDIRLPLGDLPVDGGWSAPNFAPNETNFRRMTEKQAQLTLPLPTNEPLSIELNPIQVPNAEAANRFTLAVNNVPVALTSTDVKGSGVLKGILPVEALTASHDGMAVLTFTVDQVGQAQHGPAFGLIQIQSSGETQPNAFPIDFGPTLKGTGWYDLETAPDRTSFRWMRATTATVEFTPPGVRSLVLQAQVQGGITPEIEHSLTLKVNGQAVAFAPLATNNHLYRAIIPAKIVQLNPAATTLAFSISQLASPQSLKKGDDVRPLGVAFNGLSLYPADEVVLNFDQSVVGNGWYGAEQDDQGHFQWMSATSATATVSFQPSGIDEEVVFKVAHSLAPDILSSLKLSINGDPIELQHDPLQLDGSLWWGVVPASTLARSEASGTVDITFTVARTAAPKDLGLGDDTRALGVALRWLMILPPPSAPDVSNAIPNSAGLAG